MTSPKHILGAILAGGGARRLGGGDKGLTDLGGEPVLTRVVSRLRPQVAKLILNANGDKSRFDGFGLEVVPDGEYAGLGPLTGILAVLDWARAQSGYAKVATVSTDVPFLPSDLIARLEAESGGGLAIAMSAERRHPTIALWPLGLRDAVADALRRRALSINTLAYDLGAVAADFPMRETDGRMIDPFFNVNTPEDLAAARTFVAKS